VILFRPIELFDWQQLDAFLLKHRDTSIFLRSNLARSGLQFQPKPFHAHYVGEFSGLTLTGVAAHCWNGMLLVQAADHIGELVRACVGYSGRKVSGFCGPLEQVREAQVALDLADAPTAMNEDEWLYGLDLAKITVPEILERGVVTARPPRPEERDLLCAWRLAYDIETLGSTDSLETRERSSRALDQQVAEGNAWIALEAGHPVSLSAFNAALPDIVQLGGIYTPPELRGRSYAKAAVAASLLAARERGVSRAVLFTSNPSAARSYEAVGFRRLGDFGLVLLR
jgi:RimJ/RimL family protein N-acetyltransferase